MACNNSRWKAANQSKDWRIKKKKKINFRLSLSLLLFPWCWSFSQMSLGRYLQTFREFVTSFIFRIKKLMRMFCTEVIDAAFLRNIYYFLMAGTWPPLWSIGQSFWLQIQRSRVRFPSLPDFLSSSGSGTGSTQPREVHWGATWIKKVAAPVQKTEINGRGDPLRWPRDTPLSAKVGTNFADRRRPLCRYSLLAD